MTQTTSFDAFELWKEMYNKTENVWKDVIQETLEKKSFSEGLGQIQKQYLQYQELVNKMTETYLKQVNMPTREEVASVASLIINVDAKIDSFEDQYDEQTEATVKEIEQLKKAITKLDKKLDTVTELFENLIQKSSPISIDTISENSPTKPKTKPVTK